MRQNKQTNEQNSEQNSVAARARFLSPVPFQSNRNFGGTNCHDESQIHLTRCPKNIHKNNNNNSTQRAQPMQIYSDNDTTSIPPVPEANNNNFCNLNNAQTTPFPQANNNNFYNPNPQTTHIPQANNNNFYNPNPQTTPIPQANNNNFRNPNPQTTPPQTPLASALQNLSVQQYKYVLEISLAVSRGSIEVEGRENKSARRLKVSGSDEYNISQVLEAIGYVEQLYDDGTFYVYNGAADAENILFVIDYITTLPSFAPQPYYPRRPNQMAPQKFANKQGPPLQYNQPQTFHNNTHQPSPQHFQPQYFPQQQQTKYNNFRPNQYQSAHQYQPAHPYQHVHRYNSVHSHQYGHQHGGFGYGSFGFDDDLSSMSTYSETNLNNAGRDLRAIGVKLRKQNANNNNNKNTNHTNKTEMEMDGGGNEEKAKEPLNKLLKLVSHLNDGRPIEVRHPIYGLWLTATVNGEDQKYEYIPNTNVLYIHFNLRSNKPAREEFEIRELLKSNNIKLK